VSLWVCVMKRPVTSLPISAHSPEASGPAPADPRAGQATRAPTGAGLAHDSEVGVLPAPMGAGPADGTAHRRRPARGRGRPVQLTPAVHAQIVEAIRQGNFAHVAAAAAGVPRSTFFRWKQHGTAGEARYVPFVEAIEAAEAYADTHAVAVITTAMRDDPKDAAWYLERKHPKRWGRRDRRDPVTPQAQHRVSITNQVVVPLDKVSDADLAVLARLHGLSTAPTVKALPVSSAVDALAGAHNPTSHEGSPRGGYRAERPEKPESRESVRVPSLLITKQRGRR
jgi:hypothetical protein